jgi:hypothetical protein
MLQFALNVDENVAPADTKKWGFCTVSANHFASFGWVATLIFRAVVWREFPE